MTTAGEAEDRRARRRRSAARPTREQRMTNGCKEAEGMTTNGRQEAEGLTSAGAERGFTLLELTIALVLLALLSAVLFGSVKLAGRSTDSGEAKAEGAATMRLAEEFLRTNLEAQHPLRMRKIVDWPLLFTGADDEMRYTADLPPRVAGGGIWFYRLVVSRTGVIRPRTAGGRCPRHGTPPPALREAPHTASATAGPASA